MRFTEDDLTAKAEGWALFSSNTSRSPTVEVLEIQKIDEPEDGSDPPFATDDDAIRHVMKRASGGSALHMRALLLHGTPVDAEAAFIPEACDWL